MKAVISTILLTFGLFFYGPGQNPAEIIVSSIGIDFIDGEYEVSLFNINTKTISKVETVGSVEESHSIIVHKSSDLSELMSEMSNASYRRLSFSQVSSIVLTTNTLEEIEVIDIVNIFKYSVLKYMNVFVYVTEEKITDVFNIGNIENLSLYYSLLVDPMYKYSVKAFPRPITLVEYLRDYYNYNEIMIPVLSKSEVSITESEKEVDTIIVNGYYFDRLKSIEYNDSDRTMIYLNDFEIASTTVNGISIDIKNYRIKTRCSKSGCSLKVSFEVKINSYITSSDTIELNKIVKNKFVDMLNSIYEKYKAYDIDVFNLTETMYRSENTVKKLDEINLIINVKQTFENTYV